MLVPNVKQTKINVEMDFFTRFSLKVTVLTTKTRLKVYFKALIRVSLYSDCAKNAGYREMRSLSSWTIEGLGKEGYSHLWLGL
jgi:hypothetical protein